MKEAPPRAQAPGEALVGDPDLLDDPVAHLEHAVAGSVGGQVPDVEADREAMTTFSRRATRASFVPGRTPRSA